jgi:anaerobic selenocysteine-containing dehydrogenase
VIFPATTQIEHIDVVPAWGHLYLGWNEAAIDPVGESVPNTELWRRLARAMGYTEPELFEDDESLIRSTLRGIDFDELRGNGFVPLPSKGRRLFAEGGFGGTDGRCDVSGVRYVPASTCSKAPDELVLLTPKQHARFLNSSYSHLPKHGAYEGGPFVEMSEFDAEERGVVEGSVVRVFNDQGELTLPVRVTGRLTAGVVAVPFGWWDHDFSGGAGPVAANDLTSDAPTDCGGGVAYHDTLVRVARA